MVQVPGDAARLRTGAGSARAFAPTGAIEGDDAVSWRESLHDFLFPDRAGGRCWDEQDTGAPAPPSSINHNSRGITRACAPRREGKPMIPASPSAVLRIVAGGLRSGVAMEFNCWA